MGFPVNYRLKSRANRRQIPNRKNSPEIVFLLNDEIMTRIIDVKHEFSISKLLLKCDTCVFYEFGEQFASHLLRTPQDDHKNWKMSRILSSRFNFIPIFRGSRHDFDGPGINKYHRRFSFFYDCKNCHNIPLTSPICFLVSAFYDAPLRNEEVSLSEINCHSRERKSLNRLAFSDV
jgi:hypothetical protein